MTARLPRIQRPRPIDATAWFWSFVLLLAGCFYSHVWSFVGILAHLASIACFAWQFKIWRDDSTINGSAVAWCQKYYASAGDSPVVDFMVELAHATGLDIHRLMPSTPLDKVFGMDDVDISRGPNPAHCHQCWLADIACDARVLNARFSEFSGETLGDALDFVIARGIA